MPQNLHHPSPPMAICCGFTARKTATRLTKSISRLTRRSHSKTSRPTGPSPSTTETTLPSTFNPSACRWSNARSASTPSRAQLQVVLREIPRSTASLRLRGAFFTGENRSPGHTRPRRTKSQPPNPSRHAALHRKTSGTSMDRTDSEPSFSEKGADRLRSSKQLKQP